MFFEFTAICGVNVKTVKYFNTNISFPRKPLNLNCTIDGPTDTPSIELLNFGIQKIMNCGTYLWSTCGFFYNLTS